MRALRRRRRDGGDRRRRQLHPPAVTFERSTAATVHGHAISGTAARGIEFIRMAHSPSSTTRMTDTALSPRARRTTSANHSTKQSPSPLPCALLAGWTGPAGGANLDTTAPGLYDASISRRSVRELPSPKDLRRLNAEWTVTQPSSSARCDVRSGRNDRAPGTGLRRNLFP